VEENQRSPSAYLNRGRYVRGDAPSQYDAAASPDWERVARDGEHAWHDHRAHYMGRERPPGVTVGDVFQRWELVLDVDGEPVTVRGRVTLAEPISPLDWFGAAAVAGVATLLLTRGRSIGTLALVLTTVAFAATCVGWAQFDTTPAGAGRQPLLVALPAAAAVASLIALVQRRRRLGVVAALAAVALLGSWVIYRFGVLTEPVLPTDLDWTLDRTVTAAALGASVAGALVCLRSDRFARSPSAVPSTVSSPRGA
jgi:hypothetical protein